MKNLLQVLKQLRAILILSCNIYDKITIVIAFNSIYNNFETKTSILLKFGNKNIDKIQNILYLAKARNLSKQTIDVISNVAMSFQDLFKGYKATQE